MKKIRLVILSFSVCQFAVAQVQPSLLSVQGKYLKDNCGENVVLKGVNHGNTWATNWGIPELQEIAQTGSNTVRICLQTTYNDYFTGVVMQTTAAQIEPILIECIAREMIPIIELHDWTYLHPTLTAANFLPLATNFWTRSDIKDVIKKYQNWLILNIANEPEHADMTEIGYANANKTAITGIRNAGIEAPIMIDGMYWGQGIDFFVNQGPAMIAHDPLHKLLFSVHTYWENVSNATLLARMQTISNSNLPFVLGEVAKSNGTVNPTINYTYLMELCTEYNIGFIAWWWGFINEDSNNVLSMTPTGLYSGLTDFGLTMAVSDPQSIQNTAQKPYSLTHATSCNIALLYNSSFNQSDIEIYPNPSNGKFQIKSNSKIENIQILDVTGKTILDVQTIQNDQDFDFSMLGHGSYFIKIKTNQNQIIKRIQKI